MVEQAGQERLPPWSQLTRGSMNSSGWCAWAMSPGPQTTEEMPPAWKWPASVP